MELRIHTNQSGSAAELVEKGICIDSASKGLDLLADTYYRGFDHLIVHQEHMSPDFFDLRNGMLGEWLQKFSNYRMKLSIIIQPDSLSSDSMKAFMAESNRGTLIRFAGSLDEALSG